MSNFFSNDVLNRSSDFSKYFVCIQKNGSCGVKERPKDTLVFAQNTDLYNTYNKLLSLKPETNLKDLNATQLGHLSRYVHLVYKKVDKSKKPFGLAALFVKVNNYFAAYFSIKKIEIYDYDKKEQLLQIGNRIDAMLRSKKLEVSASQEIIVDSAQQAKKGDSAQSAVSVDSAQQAKKGDSAPTTKSFDSAQQAKKGDSAQSAVSVDSTQPEKSVVLAPPAALVLPKSFGVEAFTLKSPGEAPEFEISDSQIQEITQKKEFLVLNRDRKNTVGQLMALTSKFGFPMIQDREEKERSKIRIRFILFMISDSSTLKKDARKPIQERLIKAFEDCQTIQYEAVSDIYYDLCQCGTLASSFQIRWQKYKEMVLDAWIVERHPSTKGSPAIQSEQFPHVKSAYIDFFADTLGLEGKELASQDRNRPSSHAITKGENTRSLIDQFKNRIQPKEFILILCGIINDPKDTLISKELVYNWGKMHGNKWFGNYQKEKNYEGIDKPTEEQEDQETPYISPFEVADVLIEAKILS